MVSQLPIFRSFLSESSNVAAFLPDFFMRRDIVVCMNLNKFLLMF